MDNLEMNMAMMSDLKSLFDQHEIPFHAENSRIFCFPHINNIVVQHVADKFSPNDNSNQNKNPFRHSHHPETFEEACAHQPLQRARKIIVTIRSSGQRRDQWITWIKTGMRT
jgi:hypothetical protein